MHPAAQDQAHLCVTTHFPSEIRDVPEDKPEEEGV